MSTVHGKVEGKHSAMMMIDDGDDNITLQGEWLFLPEGEGLDELFIN